jgi:RNA polymerase sigma-70 factor (ECF subfamily)
MEAPGTSSDEWGRKQTERSRDVIADFDRERVVLKDLSDEQLMLRVQGGHSVAFDELVSRYKDRLFNYLFRLVANRDDAEEIAQEAFVKAYIHAEKYKTIAKFSTWLYTIATNLVRNKMRSRGRRPKIYSLWSKSSADADEEQMIDIIDPGRTPDEKVNDTELSEIINEAIKRIPMKYRDSFVLREINQLSYEEIAAVTGLKLGTVRSRINRARNYFRQILEPLIEKGIDF